MEHRIKVNDDFNGAEQDGIGRNQLTCRGGRRCSTAVGYLHPVAERPNLMIATHQQATPVLFEGTRAMGVETAQLGQRFSWRATHEVIVCAGAYGSPQLLMLSGLGRPDELAALGIATVAEAPEVGRNLQDHPVAVGMWAVNTQDSLFGVLTPENLARYAHGTGPLTSNVAEASAFVRTRDGLPAPDVQVILLNAAIIPDSWIPLTEHGTTACVSLLTPRSRGYLTLGSPDPLAKPLIRHNYLEHPDDLRSLVAGMRLTMELAARRRVAGLISATRAAPASTSDDDITAHIRATMQTTYHPTSSCRMGPDNHSVVDLDCRVRGVEGLRVVDASIMPSVPRGNTNAPTIAVAEKAADLIQDIPARPAGVPG